MSLLTTLQCADVFSVISNKINNASFLLLGMCCRALRQATDADQWRMGHALWIASWAANSTELSVKEYACEVILRIDCQTTLRFRRQIMTSLTGLTDEILVMGVAVHGMHTDETFTRKVQTTKARHWKLLMKHSEQDIHPSAKFGIYTLTMRSVDPNSEFRKPIYLVLENIELPCKPVKRRSLLALRQHSRCMLCMTRFATYCAVDCDEPRMRKLCKRCANETMVTERNLVRQWMVGHEDMAQLRVQTLRYYANSGAYYLKWIPKYLVCRHFGDGSWENFMLNTNARRNGRQDSTTRAIHGWSRFSTALGAADAQ